MLVNYETNLMSLINPSLAYVYCSNLVSNHVLISLIRFVSRFTIYLCNVIYFSTTFSTPCKRFIKILHFSFWDLNRALIFPPHHSVQNQKGTSAALHMQCRHCRAAAMWASPLRKMQQGLALSQSHCLCGVLWGCGHCGWV